METTIFGRRPRKHIFPMPPSVGRQRAVEKKIRLTPPASIIDSRDKASRIGELKSSPLATEVIVLMKDFGNAGTSD
jgi:hypothetical protein